MNAPDDFAQYISHVQNLQPIAQHLLNVFFDGYGIGYINAAERAIE